MRFRSLALFSTLLVITLPSVAAFACSPEPRTDPNKKYWPTGADAPINAGILLRTTLEAPTVIVTSGETVVDGRITGSGPVYQWKPSADFQTSQTYTVQVVWRGDQIEEASEFTFTTGTKTYSPPLRTGDSLFEARAKRYDVIRKVQATQGGMCATNEVLERLDRLQVLVGKSGFTGGATDFITTSVESQRGIMEPVTNDATDPLRFDLGDLAQDIGSEACVEVSWIDAITEQLISKERRCAPVTREDGVFQTPEFSKIHGSKALGANYPGGCSASQGDNAWPSLCAVFVAWFFARRQPRAKD